MCEGTFLATASQYPEEYALFEGSEALPNCNSDKNSITMKMNMEY
jgi:hypothetical protein